VSSLLLLEPPPRVPPSQPLVALLHDHVARTGPNAHAGRIESVAARRPLTRARTVLPILARASSRKRGSWLQVRLPGRPNSHKGWISTNRTRLTSTYWRIAVKLSTRRLTVYFGGSVRRHFRVVVGKPSTPTPRGVFFIEEALALSSYEAGGPYALATSARSNVFQEFEGGPGQIGIHGTNNLSGEPGTAVSHGCIRLGTHAITWLARRVGAGVPLRIMR
jgi:lipoprotein-anchoring transpeptidase ErfK/SrfK